MQEFIKNIIPRTTFEIIFLIFIFFTFVQLLYYLFFYSRFFFLKKNKTKEQEQQGVSVVICAKNEEENLEKYLRNFLNQNYKNFEVVVVNDCSTDNSLRILYQIQKEYSNLYVTNIEIDNKFSHGKKLAQTVGIKAAKNDIILFSDADCYPVSDRWISSVVRNFSEKTEFLLGYGAYKKNKGFLNKIIRYDTLFITMQYLSFAKAGFPYMGVGRNLAYRKSTWKKNRGFATHTHILSGDDDLFVNKNANRKNTKIEVSSESITESEPGKTYKKFIRQKKRHLTTGKYYKFKHKILLGAEIISRVLFYISFIILISFFKFPEYVAGIFLIRLLIQLLIIGKTSKILNEKNIFLLSPILDIFMLFVGISVYFSNLLLKKKIIWR